MSGHIYILTDGINTKIGITIDLDKRLSSYKTHNPNFQTFKTYPCDIEEAKRVESVIKQAFKDNLSGTSKEWFSVNPEIIDRYVSTLLLTSKEDQITPAMHGVRLTNEAYELKEKITNVIEKKVKASGEQSRALKLDFAELFSNRFRLGIPEHKLPEDIVVRDCLNVDLEYCDNKSLVTRRGIEHNFLQMPYDDHVYNFYHLVKLASGHFIAICTAKISMPYLKAIEGKTDEIIKATNEAGWYATFHHDWSWWYPDKSGLILFQKKTNVPVLLNKWDRSFRKWVIERAEILKHENFKDKCTLEKAIEDTKHDNTFPLNINSYDELCDKYLQPFWGYTKDDGEFWLRGAYEFLLSKWKDCRVR